MKKTVFVYVLGVFIFIIIFVISTFPLLIRMDDSIDLGKGYRFIQDYPQMIIYHDSTKQYNGSGYSVVYPVVLNYNSNKDFIIAKTKDLETKDTLFWIVNKTEQKTEHFLDSLEFYNFLKKKNINLELKLK
jgi:hypothetical protein